MNPLRLEQKPESRPYSTMIDTYLDEEFDILLSKSLPCTHSESWGGGLGYKYSPDDWIPNSGLRLATAQKKSASGVEENAETFTT